MYAEEARICRLSHFVCKRPAIETIMPTADSLFLLYQLGLTYFDLSTILLHPLTKWDENVSEMGEPMTKKIRVWNPAIDDLGKDDSSSPSTSPTQPLDFSKSVFPPQMPLLMQVSLKGYCCEFRRPFLSKIQCSLPNYPFWNCKLLNFLSIFRGDLNSGHRAPRLSTAFVPRPFPWLWSVSWNMWSFPDAEASLLVKL